MFTRLPTPLTTPTRRARRARRGEGHTLLRRAAGCTRGLPPGLPPVRWARQRRGRFSRSAARAHRHGCHLQTWIQLALPPRRTRPLPARTGNANPTGPPSPACPLRRTPCPSSRVHVGHERDTIARPHRGTRPGRRLSLVDGAACARDRCARNGLQPARRLRGGARRRTGRGGRGIPFSARRRAVRGARRSHHRTASARRTPARRVHDRSRLMGARARRVPMPVPSDAPMHDAPTRNAGRGVVGRSVYATSSRAAWPAASRATRAIAVAPSRSSIAAAATPCSWPCSTGSVPTRSSGRARS